MPLLHSLFHDLSCGSSQLYDQNFGSGLLVGDLASLPSLSALISVPFKSGYLRLWRYTNPKDSGTSKIDYMQHNFKMMLDVKQFKPEELKVKVCDDYIMVEGKHEEREDEHGYVSRQFARRYKLPNDVDDKTLKSTISSDGMLILEANKKEVLPACFYKEIPIVETKYPACMRDCKAVVKKDDMQVLPAHYYQNIQTNQLPKQVPIQESGNTIKTAQENMATN